MGSLTLHRLGFGTMQLTGPGVWGPPRDHDAAIAILRRAIDLGVEFVDTADSYGPSVSEELVREALYPYPKQLKIATKAGLTRPGPDKWVPRGNPEYLREQCEGSLRRLGVDQIDLFQLHRIDPDVPAEAQFELLKDLHDEGKVAEVGLSQATVFQVAAARQLLPIVSVQNEYNLANRGAEEVLDYCQQEGIAFIPAFPLASGKLSQPWGPLGGIAQELGATPTQVSLAWLLRRSPVMLPIPGTSSISHVEENCAAADITLTDKQFQKLTKARLSSRWAAGRVRIPRGKS